MTRDEWAAYEKIRRDPNVRLAMKGRCEEEDHAMESCMTVAFQIYEECKWCGAIKK